MLPSRLALCCLLAACGPQGGSPLPASRPSPPARTVRLVQIELATAPGEISVHGTLRADDSVELGFKVPGRLQLIPVDLGDQVKKGDLFARLDATDYQLRLQQARAALHQARVRLGLPMEGDDDAIDPEATAIVREAKAVLAEEQLKRKRAAELVQQKLAPEAQLDAAVAAAAVAESRLQEAREEVKNRQATLQQRRAELAIAQQHVEETVLRAPFDGAVAQRTGTPGRYVEAGEGVCVLLRTDPLRLRLPVPDQAAPLLRPGQQVAFTVDGDPRTHAGQVARLSPEIDTRTRTRTIEAVVPNPDGELRAGSFARARIVLQPDRKAPCVRTSALVAFAGVEKVFVVREGKAAEVVVRTGPRRGDLVELVSGPEAGTEVVDAPGDLASGTPLLVAR
jgi:multidrug efflux pump subunit AcrA (membrane-fusion protein)